MSVAVFAAPLAAKGQQAGRVYRVGLVSLGGDPQWWRPVLEAMEELGYVEGRNLVVRRAFAKGHPENLPRLVGELLRSGVDAVVTTAARETRAVKQAAPNTPIVMLLVPDPVTEGFVRTLAHPGGNVTGLTIFAPSFVQKYVELLREVVPSASRFVVLGNPGGPPPEIRAELESAARTFGIMLSIIPVSDPEQIDAALARAKREGAAGLIDAPNYVTFIHRRRLAQTALKYGMPGIYWAREYAQDGGPVDVQPRYDGVASSRGDVR
jgi:putative ABC transport system substrate-binding protein